MSSESDDELLLDYLHGQLSEEGTQQLEERLRTNRALGQQLQRLACEESVLAEWTRARSMSPGDAAAESPRVRVASSAKGREWPVGWRTLSAASLAATLLLAAYFVWPAEARHEATIVQTVDAEFAGAESYGLGSRLAIGDWVRLEAGWVEIAYRTGPRVVLQAPAEFQIAAHRSGRLEHGTLSAEATDGAFQITTPAGTVTDLGTRFAVSVLEENQAAVEVFDGKVLAQPAGAKAAVEATLDQGEAALIDRAKQETQPLQAGQPQFVLVRQHLERKTIEAVADHFVRGGDWADSVEREKNNEWMLLKRDLWRRLGVCRKAWIRFELGQDPLHATSATFTFRHANSNAPGSTASHFKGKIHLYGLRSGYVPSGASLGTDWAEDRLTWNNAPGNNVADASGLTDAAEFLGSVDVNAGPKGSAAGTSFSFNIPDLSRYRQADGSVTLILSVAEQSGFDPNLYVVARESREFAGPLLTYTTGEKE